MPIHAAIITLLTSLLLAMATAAVGRARSKFGIKAPATTGHIDFERVFRAHMNTLEAAVIFLPVLWLAAHYSPFHPLLTAGLGYAWVAGRLWYLFGYWQAAGKRGTGFIMAFVAWVGLFILAAAGVGKTFFN